MAFCVIIAIIVTLGSTFSWFTSMDSATNNIRHESEGGFSVKLVDEFDPGPTPGGSYTKRVGAANMNTNPGFVRLLVEVMFVLPSGTPGVPDIILPAEFGTYITMDSPNLASWNGSAFTGGDWIRGEDGYYYFLDVLPGGASTDAGYSYSGNVYAPKARNLFNSVTIDESKLPAGYSGANLRIEVKSEAVGLRKYDYRVGWWKDTSNKTDNTALPLSTPTLRRLDSLFAGLAH